MQNLRHDIMNLWLVGALVFIACTSVMREGNAAPPLEPAEALFWDAAKLVELKQFAEACPKFAQSLALLRKAGTLFALSDCEDQQGKLATAFRWYGEYIAEVEKLPIEQKQRHAERVKMALDRMQQLAPRIPTLTFLLPVGATKKPVVTVDDVPVDPDSWGNPHGVDPGERVVVVRLDGQVRQEEHIQLDEGQHYEFHLDVPFAAPLKPVDQRSNRLRTAGFISMGVGGVGLVLGAIAGGMALSKKDEMLRYCAAKSKEVMDCYPPGIVAGNDAKLFGNISTGAIVGGGVALGLGLAMVAVDVRGRTSSNARVMPVHVSVVAAPNGGGGMLGIAGRW